MLQNFLIQCHSFPCVWQKGYNFERVKKGGPQAKYLKSVSFAEDCVDHLNFARGLPITFCRCLESMHIKATAF
jgi:hypothetical protein